MSDRFGPLRKYELVTMLDDGEWDARITTPDGDSATGVGLSEHAAIMEAA